LDTVVQALICHDFLLYGRAWVQGATREFTETSNLPGITTEFRRIRVKDVVQNKPPDGAVVLRVWVLI
jgi:hypothetical protein